MTWNWNWAVLQADSTLSRLNVLRKKIDDTEALISIHLDSRRNDLVAFDLVRLPVIERPPPWELGTLLRALQHVAAVLLPPLLR